MIKFFSEIGLENIHSCGGKGASLGELTCSGFKIPNGFVLTSDVYGTDVKSWESEALAAFDSLGCHFVAVRSSGTKEDGIEDSFAGQFDTYLYVDRENLIGKIHGCHESINSPRLIAYCKLKKIDIKQIKVAIVIQKMVNSEVAGVAFSINPISYNSHEIMIEAGYGLGEAVVSGFITPDNYIVNKKTQLLKKEISTQEKQIILDIENGGTQEEIVLNELQGKQKLTESNIDSLFQNVLKIEQHYGMPMDIEWALEKGEIYILQARPMTTIGEYREKYHFMWGQKQSAMIAEAMVLNFILYNDEFTITENINNVIREHAQGFSYIYFSHTSLEEGFLNGNIYLTHEGRKIIFDMIQKVQEDFHTIIQKIQKIKYPELSQSEKHEIFSEYMKCVIFIQKLFRASDPSATRIIEEKLLEHLEDIFGQESAMTVMTDLVTSHLLDRTQEEIRDFYALISEEQQTSLQIQKHGLSYPGNFANVWSIDEIEKFLHEKAQNTNISELKNEIESIYKNKQELHARQQDIIKKIDPNFIEYAKTLQHLGTTRFHLKHCWSGAEILSMDFLRCVSDELGLEYETFMMSYNFSDILSYFETGARLTEDEIRDRLYYSIIHVQGNKTEYLYGEKAKQYFQKLYSVEETGSNLKGMCANGGNATGKVRIVIVDDIKQFKIDCEAFQHGEILVTTMTSPLMMELAKKSAGIITNEGGICSHAAIIARELKIPCVVGTKTATKILKTGDTVSIRADSGSIKIL